MVLMPVLCPHCHSDQVIKGGKTKAGQQRYKCQNSDCPCYSFSSISPTKAVRLRSKSKSSTWLSMAVASAIRHGC